MIRVKICGLNDPAAFDAAVEAGADWVGFVFFPPSPRYVTPQLAHQLSSRAPSGPGRVGLFVRPTPDEIARTVESVHLDVVQLYGVEDLAVIKPRFAGEVWRAVGVSARQDLPTQADDQISRLVIEAKAPASANRPGGNATSFDWKITRGWEPPCPWILAGGLEPGNVADAITASGATAVDVSSGVETTVGVKNPERIRAFIRAVKACGSAS